MIKKLSLLVFMSLSISAFSQTKKAPVKKVVAAPLSAAAQESFKRGRQVYNLNCLTCHQADGGGVPNMNAPLIKTSYVLGDKKRLISILMKGMKDVEIDGETYSNVMPSFSYLSNQQIADVLTFVRNTYGNKASVITADEVKILKK